MHLPVDKEQGQEMAFILAKAVEYARAIIPQNDKVYYHSFVEIEMFIEKNVAFVTILDLEQELFNLFTDPNKLARTLRRHLHSFNTMPASKILTTTAWKHQGDFSPQNDRIKNAIKYLLYLFDEFEEYEQDEAHEYLRIDRTDYDITINAWCVFIQNIEEMLRDAGYENFISKQVA